MSARTWKTPNEQHAEIVTRLARIEFMLETMWLALQLAPPDVLPMPIEPDTEEVYT